MGSLTFTAMIVKHVFTREMVIGVYLILVISTLENSCTLIAEKLSAWP